MRFLAVALLMLQQTTQTLASLQGSHRVLLVFARSQNDPIYQQQIKLLNSNKAALEERDLTVLPLPGASSDREQATLRHRFHIAANDFTVLLIGKDGGEKFRKRAILSIDQLNATIDAMPMRREEIRNRPPR